MVEFSLQWAMRKKHYLLVCLTIVLAWIINSVWTENSSLGAKNMSLTGEMIFYGIKSSHLS